MNLFKYLFGGWSTLFKKRRKESQKQHTPRIERDTECDTCQYLKECLSEGYLLNCSSLEDARAHYIKGRGCECKMGVSISAKELEDWTATFSMNQ